MIKFYKKIITKKIIVTTLALITLFLIYLIPKDDSLQNKLPQELEYVDREVMTNVIYLLDGNDYLGKTKVVINSNNQTIEKKAKELMEILIKDGAGESKIPSGFRSLLPAETKVLSIKYEKNLMKINFSKDLLNVEEWLEEKVVEAIVYTLTSINGVDNVIIYVEGDILSKLPQSKINLPSTLNRDFGINKKYDLKSNKGINQVTVYYVNKFNNDYYYVPVTKYLNDSREKIHIIIDELSSSHVYNNNLMSFLSNNAKLLSVEQTNDIMQLKFNTYLFSDIVNQDILEEVIYTICLSIKDNYSVKEVVFEVENQEILKKVLKTIE